MPTPEESNFEALEKQLAKDALEKALKDLHGEITQEINKNKKAFSDEINKSLLSFTEKLEKHLSQEIDQKLPSFLNKNFADISEKVKSSFEQMFVPVLDKTKEDMKRLEIQGEKTLQSWGNMMKQYESIWTKPFFLMLLISLLLGTTISLFSSYFLTRADRDSRQRYEQLLNWYVTEYFKLKKPENQAPSIQPEASNNTKNRKQNKKKSK